MTREEEIIKASIEYTSESKPKCIGEANLVEILKDCPKGMELDCTMYENVTFYGINESNPFYPIEIIVENIDKHFMKSLNQYGCYDNYGKCVIFPKGKTTWEGFVLPCQFKDGDVVTTSAGRQIFVHKNRGECYFGLDFKDNKMFGEGAWAFSRFATEEEKQKLFDAIKENGYKWNAETKTLEELIVPKFKVGDRVRIIDSGFLGTISHLDNNIYKISCNDGVTAYNVSVNRQGELELVPNKFDISTLKPFDKVLVRDYDGHKWQIELFSSVNGDYHRFICLQSSFNQCIPYEGNEHLLGTTNDCDEYYKTWEL